MAQQDEEIKQLERELQEILVAEAAAGKPGIFDTVQAVPGPKINRAPQPQQFQEAEIREIPIMKQAKAEKPRQPMPQEFPAHMKVKGDRNMAAPARRPGGNFGGIQLDPTSLYPILMRVLCGLLVIAGYWLSINIQMKLWQRVLPPKALGDQASWALSILGTAFVNILESVFRNASNFGRDLLYIGIAAYFVDAFVHFGGFIVVGSYDASWFPLGAQTQHMTWVDWFLVIVATAILTFILEPLIEYTISGEFYWLGRRFGM